MSSPAADVVRLLTVRGETVAVAESLTGGLVAAEITSVPGASKVFRGSITAYATDLKRKLLKVDATLLAQRGAVDPQVAAQMATGVRDLLGADWGIATTGVAGPDPQDGQPVGTVFVAVAGPGRTETGAAHDGKTSALRLNGSRAEIRRESARSVLALLLDRIASQQTGNERAQDTERNGGF
ncbi:CinA family protein [Streptomyces sp. NPDC046985]|uniref:CinA family protein n=1 Tax=Streptomyces sp. NPDC046985 TaxID=3155377 RepID=UPI0033E203F0